MKTFKKLFFAIIGGLILASCGSSLQITTDYDRTVDFSKYKTFGIYKLSPDAQTISQLNVLRIYSSIRTAMKDKGLTESNNPDIWINSLMVVDIREQHSSTTTTMGMGMGMGGWGWGMGGMHRPYAWGNPMMMGGPMMMNSTAHTQHHVDIYKKGTLLIDIIDARTNSLVWHANGNKKISDSMKRNPDENILKYVKQILESFPPSSLVHSVNIIND